MVSLFLLVRSQPNVGNDPARNSWGALSIHLTLFSPLPLSISLFSMSVSPFSSVQFSRLVVSDSLRPHEPQHSRLPCPSQLPESTQTHVRWVGDVIQPFHPLLSLSPPASIFPSIRVFSNESVLRIRWPKYWSFLQGASVLPVNIQDWSPLGWTGWISLQSKELSRVFSNTTVQKHQFFGAQLSL